MAVGGLILGILGLVSGYWFYRATLLIPSLSLLDVGSHLRLVDVGAVNDGPIRLVHKDGRPVSKNVYLARLYLWNSGNVRIAHSDIVAKRPLVIKAPGVEILDSKMLVSPDLDITGLALLKNGTDSISVNFDLLQPNDGCSLNVLYAADVPTVFIMTGKVLGVESFAASISNSELAIQTAKQVLKIIGILGTISGFAVGLGLVAALVDNGVKKANNPLLFKIAAVTKWILAAGFACAIAALITAAAKQQVMRDPANFVPKTLITDMPQPVSTRGGK